MNTLVQTNPSCWLQGEIKDIQMKFLSVLNFPCNFSWYIRRLFHLLRRTSRIFSLISKKRIHICLKLNTFFTLVLKAMRGKTKRKMTKFRGKVFGNEMNFLRFHLQMKNEKVSVCSLPGEQKANTAEKLKFCRKMLSFCWMLFLRIVWALSNSSLK